MVASLSPFGPSVNASNVLVINFDVIPASIYADPSGKLFKDPSNPLNWWKVNNCSQQVTAAFAVSYCLSRSFLNGSNAALFGSWLPDFSPFASAISAATKACSVADKACTTATKICKGSRKGSKACKTATATCKTATKTCSATADTAAARPCCTTCVWGERIPEFDASSLIEASKAGVVNDVIANLAAGVGTEVREAQVIFISVIIYV